MRSYIITFVRHFVTAISTNCQLQLHTMVFGKVHDGIRALSELSGLDETNVKILTTTALSFPFSIIFKRLPDNNYTLKNWYIIAVSSFYVFVICELGSGLRSLLISATGTYLITRYLRTDLMPWINFLFLMGHLLSTHFLLQFFQEYDPTVIDITGAQMVMVMKLSAFGWNVHDARVNVDNLSPYLKTRVIKEHPNILPYLGYVFFYPSLMTGPAFDYVDYDRFIHSTLFDDVPDDKRPGKRKRRIPRSGKPALRKVLQGLFWAALFVVMPKYVSLDYALDEGFVTDKSFVYRCFYLWVLGLTYRLKYYTIWLIAEGACILCGIGYNGYDPDTGKFKWNRVQNIDPVAFETGQNVHTCLEAWNMNTNKWLKYYVYVRLAKPGKKPGFKSTLCTFATSAAWHGTRPGYYLTFVMGAFMQTLGKIYRRNIRPIFLEADGKTPKRSKIYYDVVSYIVTQLAFGFIVQPFVILDFKKSVYCWSTVYFYVIIATAITLVAFKGPFKKQVTEFFQSHQAAHRLAEEKKKQEKLTEHEASKVHKTVDKVLRRDGGDDMPTLGVPSIDELENMSKEELEEDMRELQVAWQSFKDRKGFSDDIDNLKDAYKNFTEEIEEIFEEQRKALKQKSQ